MNAVLARVFATADAAPGVSAAPMGKWVFVAALVLLLVWLIMMPGRLIGQARGAPAWWRNVRVWAVVITVVQIWVYAYFA